ncbi:MAG: FtsX-like permease family protein, partial [Dehalococcoidia bacterium]|nr:FtsX-like permease family protein [Dehalococcoidia bacterium]
ALESRPARDTDLLVASSSQDFAGAAFETRKTTTDAMLQANAGELLRDIVHYGRTSTFYLAPAGAPIPEGADRPRAHFQFADDLQEHVRVVEGRAPAPFVPVANGHPVIEVWAGRAAAEQHGFGVGDSFELYPHWRPERPVTVTVVGLIEPEDADEAYWFGRTDRFRVDTRSWPTYPFFTDEASLARGLTSYLNDLDGTFETYGFIDISRITNENARQVEDRIRGLDGAVRANLQYSYLETGLDDTLAGYREQLFFTRLPLFALMAQVVGIALFYLVMVSTAVVERQAGEIALMKSRGASNAQVLGVFAIEGAGIALLATVIAPLLAAGAIMLLGLTPSFNDLSGGSLLEVHLSPWAFAMAAFGALLAFAALLWPAYRATRHTVAQQKQLTSRPPQQSAFMRYYLDLVVLAIGAFAFYQLRQRGSLVTENVFGDLSADPLLLATPSLFMLTVALVFLRLFPLALRAILWLVSKTRGATLALGLTRMARAPVHHSRLILLLILTTAVGMFAAGFRATLENGYEDRAAYRAGAELRFTDVREPQSLPVDAFEREVQRVAGEREVASAVRAPAYYSPTRFRSESGSLLGVEIDDFQALAFWRGDFASRSLQSLLESVRYSPQPPPSAPALVPAGARWIGAWVNVPAIQGAPPQLGLRLRNDAGVFWEYRLQASPGAGDWVFYIAQLDSPRVGPGQPPGAVTLESLYLQFGGTQPRVIETHEALIGPVQVSSAAELSRSANTDGFEDPQTIEDFSDPVRYELLRGATLAGNPGAFSHVPGGSPFGNAVRLAFTRGSGSSPIVGIRAASDSAPLAVLANEQFLDAQDKKVGDEFILFVNNQYVDVRVAGSFKLFPTFDPDTGEHLFVADLAAVRDRATRLPGYGGGAYPNEAWLGPGPGGFTKDGLTEAGFRVDGIFERAAILAEQRDDPLVAASWEGILFLAFSTVLLLSGLGFVIYSGISARARSVEFAILRTMGLSGRQLLGVVSFEQLFVVGSGVAAGTLLGFPLSRLMISYMGLTERGEDPLPPLISSVSWQAALTVYTLLGIVIVTTVLALITLYSRVAVGRALRMGEL